MRFEGNVDCRMQRRVLLSTLGVSQKIWSDSSTFRKISYEAEFGEGDYWRWKCTMHHHLSNTGINMVSS